MALGLIQPQTEMSTRGISLGVRQLVHRAVKFATFVYQLYRSSWSLNFMDPSELAQACVGGWGFALPLTFALPAASREL